MSQNTPIEWTDSSWNPTEGCSMAKGSENGGCLNCYAARTALRRPASGLAVMRDSGPRWTGKVGLVEKHLMDPLHWRKPQKIFVNSMSDLFHESLPDEAIDHVFAVMALCPQHTFQVLTKRSGRMLDYLSKANHYEARRRVQDLLDPSGRDPSGVAMKLFKRWPLPNVWLGVSVENRATLERLYDLGRVPAAVRFISYEPALEAVGDFRLPHFACNMGLPNPDWIIVGGESGHGARPFDIQWARDTIEVCKLGRIACFVKQVGSQPIDPSIGYWPKIGHTSRPHLDDRKGGDWSEWPEDLRVRQFPGDLKRVFLPPAHKAD